MAERFFIDEPISSDEVVLVGAEAHHLLNVRRGKPGQEVTLFDGTGREFTAEIAECGRREARLVVVSSRTISREPPIELTLGVALPKGERQRWLVEKVVELGASSLVPLVTEFSVSKPTESALARLRRAVIEASKQCGRTRLMQVDEPAGCLEFFAQPIASHAEGTVRICADPGGEDPMTAGPSPVQRVTLAVGPEGGFSEPEIQAAREAGWSIRSLGPRILRVETAAVALTAFFTLGTGEAAGSG